PPAALEHAAGLVGSKQSQYDTGRNLERTYRQNRAAFRCSSGIGRLADNNRRGNRWRNDRGGRQRQWQHISATAWRLVATALALLLLSGCASRQPDFAALYAQAKHDFEHGDL